MATRNTRARTELGRPSRFKRFMDNDIVWSFLHSPGAIIAATVTVLAIAAVGVWSLLYRGIKRKKEGGDA